MSVANTILYHNQNSFVFKIIVENELDRRALVTASGVVLGFVIQFGADWIRDGAKEAWNIQEDLYFLVPFGVSVLFLTLTIIWVLYPTGKAMGELRYKSCLLFFFFGIVSAVWTLFGYTFS